jgi:hypothetical protein
MDTAPVATQGISPDRPWPASSGLRSSVAGFASPDRRRENPSAISRALSPIAHKGACADDVTRAIADRRTSLVLMRLLHNGPILSTDRLPHLLIAVWGNTRGAVARMFQAGSRQGNKSLRRRSGSTDGS